MPTQHDGQSESFFSQFLDLTLTEALLDALGVVVCPTTCLASLRQSLQHRLFAALEEEHKAREAYSLVKAEGLVHLPGKTIDEEPSFAICPLALLLFRHIESGSLRLDCFVHGVFEKGNRHFLRHNLALLDVVCNELSKFRAFSLLLRSKQVTGWVKGRG